MRILLIFTMIGSKAKWHQGIASLATYIKVHGYDCRLLEVYENNLNIIEEAVKSYDPAIVAATANSHQFPYVVEMLRHVKDIRPDIYTVIGGVAVTVDPESIAFIENIDAVCRGEGEQPLLDIVRAVEGGIEPANIENMIFPGKPDISAKSCTYYVKDLNTLPIADRNFFERFRNSAKTPMMLPVRFLFCRGCPFNCSYCCNKVMKDNFPKPSDYVRQVSVDRAIEELNLVSDQYKFDHFVIDDDIFTLNKRWTMDFCNRYPEKLLATKSFHCNVRIGTVDEEMMKALKSIGCTQLELGIESGDADLRYKVLNRKITDEMIRETKDMAKRAGIHLQTFNMVGIPGETRRSIFKTIRTNQIIKPKELQITVFYPYPHTALGEYCKEKGMIASTSNTYFNKSVLKHDKLSKGEIEFYAKFFKFFVYSSYSLGRAKEELKAIIKSSDKVKRLIIRFKGGPSKVNTNVKLTTPPYVDRHKGRDFLILASGPTLREQRDEIQRFIDKHNPIVMAGNFIDNLFVPDYHGFTNRKRFMAYINKVNTNSKLLLSPYFANRIIKEYYKGKYEEIAFDDIYPGKIGSIEIKDGIIYSEGATVGTILIGVALVMGAENIYIAGMDGYSKSSSSHFYKETDNKKREELLHQEMLVTNQLKQVREYLKQNKRGR
ncbi:MAG: radical SAM protein, partial [Nitrospirae bacterium]|nr:radical SAM protein [Nitrospirota bacterium]